MNTKHKDTNNSVKRVLMNLLETMKHHADDSTVKNELNNLPEHLLADVGMDEESMKIKNEREILSCSKCRGN